jgi:hypothetical protein
MKICKILIEDYEFLVDDKEISYSDYHHDYYFAGKFPCKIIEEIEIPEEEERGLKLTSEYEMRFFFS